MEMFRRLGIEHFGVADRKGHLNWQKTRTSKKKKKKTLRIHVTVDQLVTVVASGRPNYIGHFTSHYCTGAAVTFGRRGEEAKRGGYYLTIFLRLTSYAAISS